MWYPHRGISLFYYCCGFSAIQKIKCSVTSKNEKKGLNHPIQKHIEVMQWIIKTLTNENDVIFDPFSGTGTTDVVALMEKRNFVEIEKDERYFNEMSERFSQLQD